MHGLVNSSINGKGIRPLRNSLISCVSNHKIRSLPPPPLCVALYPAAVVWLSYSPFKPLFIFRPLDLLIEKPINTAPINMGAWHAPTSKVVYGIYVGRKTECPN